MRKRLEMNYSLQSSAEKTEAEFEMKDYYCLRIMTMQRESA